MRVIVCLFSVVFLWNSWTSASDSKATALLKGVANERLKQNRFQIRYEEIRREEGKAAIQIVDFDNGKIRKEHLPNDKFHGMMSLFLGDIVYVRTSYDANSVELVAPTSIHASGADIYDPRLLGLTDMMNLGTTIEDCLGFSSGKNFTVEPVTLDGKSVHLVTWEEGDNLWEFYIEEPGFRVLKNTVKDAFLDIQIDCEYSNPALGPFPSKVTILRKIKNEIRFDRTITVQEFKVQKSSPPETFTLASLNLPLNAMVTDYRINRLVGYWDGEKLVDDPVTASAQEMREWEAMRNRQLLGGAVRYVMMGAGVLMIAYALFAKFREWKRGRPSE